ncbi:flagellar hook-associated protein FlgL [Sulfobacillus harzensis]|uniref:Flagellar hook-associated protein FlgL n=1 Tax=Sulfobacillus harzensis TaxID=2729629 RepID=A0A7Y0L5G4_9FIRM|nr:flagellar hook-associated protein FlgL [Sulfobacillus harzensis]NMP23081.1 flagellar hook-associated protein FlgL [Sulfobacillus harzensis]
MNVTPMTIANSLLQNIQNQESQITQLQQEESTGQSFQVPSDNPIAAENTLGLNNTLSQLQGYTQSAQAAEGWINQTNGVLSSMISLWDQALQTATQAANSTNNPSDLNAMAETVKGLQQNFGELLNTQYEGSYIFSGYNDQTPPIGSTGATNPWPAGATDARTFGIDTNTNVTVNLTGWENVGQGGTSTAPVNYLLQAYQDLGTLSQDISSGPTAVKGMLKGLNQDLSNLTSAQALEGGRLARVKNTLTQLQNASSDLSQNIANTSGANMAQVTTQLAQEEDAYQAALQSGSKILSLSLLNYINP